MPPSFSVLQNPTHRKKILAVLTLLLWLVCLYRAISVLGPDSDHVYFNSDGAIPILMANDQRPITVFDHYYYAAGRWGAWPLITARLINHSTNYRWTAKSLHIVRSVWLFIGIFVFALLNRRLAFLVVLICLMLICLNYLIRLRLFDLSQVYSWQLTALLFGWYSLRQLFSDDLTASSGKPLLAKRALWCFLLFWFSFLAVWSSFASGPFLCFLVVLEAARSRLHSGKAHARNWPLLRYVWGFALVALAILAEIFMRMNYHRHALKHYGNPFKTAIGLDTEYLAQNLEVQLKSLIHFPLWTLNLITLGALIAGVGSFIYFKVKRRSDGLAKLRARVLDDTGIMILGSFGIAAINFALIIVVNHVRLNLYDNRFATFTFFFGSISGLLTLYLLLRGLLSKTTIARYVFPALATVGFVFLMIKFPAPNPSALFRVEQETALALADKTPKACLMGGYWSTYVFAALQPTNNMIPLPLEGEFVRMPWTIKMLKGEKHVIVEYRRTNHGLPYSPPEQLIQYGNPLRLVEPKFYENGPYEFALYVNTSN